MDIKTKFNIGDSCYFAYASLDELFEIDRIAIMIQKDSSLQITYDISRESDHVSYKSVNETFLLTRSEQLAIKISDINGIINDNERCINDEKEEIARLNADNQRLRKELESLVKEKERLDKLRQMSQLSHLK